MDEVSINTIVINTKRYVIFLMVWFFGGVGIFLLSGILLSSFIVVAIGIFATFIGFIVFEKKIRRAFTKKAIIVFAARGFSIDLVDRNDKRLLSHEEYDYTAIKYVKAADSAKDDSAFMKLYFRDDRIAYYTFLEQGENEKVPDVIDVLVERIHQFNLGQREDSRITPLPMLLATKNSKYYISGLTALIIVAIIFQIVYKPKGIPVTLFSGFIFYALILLQRKRDIDQYNRMKF